MRIPRLYSDQALAVGSIGELKDNSAHYVHNVLRMDSGRPILLFNGAGGEYTANLTRVSKKIVTFEVTGFIEGNRDSKLHSHLAIGISRGDKMDYVLQKATELGVSKITPLFTERTEVKLSGERLQKKMQHWQQVIVSACEQSQRNILPTLLPPISLTDFFSETKNTENELCRLILHPGESNFSIQTSPIQTNAVLLVGPEGGFSEYEIKEAEKNKFKTWVLGPRILRTETAPLAALSVLQQLWGDWE
ncbi:MAG: 16S rRNA (uracil(1498)-N(3))-methyltransferase [Cellvibrionaceae bacterium]